MLKLFNAKMRKC